MILRRLKVSGVGVFRESLELSGFHDGINLIVGPNEIGKSTLIRALKCALFYKYSSRDREIKSLQPWGTMLAPQIEVDFEAKGDLYRLQKKFLDAPFSTLYRFEKGKFQKFAELDRADDFVQELLLVPKKPKKETRLGLARLLWVDQGGDHLKLESLPIELEEKIRAILGSSGITGFEESFLKGIKEEYGKLFTERGRFITGQRAPKVVNLRDEIEKLRKELNEIDSLIDSAERKAERIEFERNNIEKLRSDLEERNRKIKKLREEYEIYKNLKNKLARKRETEQTLRIKFKNHNKNLKRLIELRELKEEKEKKLEELQKRIEEMDKIAVEYGKKADEFKARLEALRKDIEAKRSEREKAEKLREAVELTDKIAALEKKISDLKALEDEIARAKEVLQSIRAPAEDEIKRARRLNTQLITLKSKGEAAGFKFKVSALAPFRTEIKKDSENIVQDVLSGSEVSYDVLEKIQMKIPGLLQIDVSSKSPESKKLKESIEKVEAELQKIFKKYGCENVAELEERAREKLKKEGELRRLLSNRTILSGGEKIENMEKKRAENEKKLEKLLEELKMNKSELKLPAGIEAIKAELQKLEEDFRKTEAEIKKVEKLLKNTEREKTELNKRAVRLHAELESSEDETKRILQEYGDEEKLKTAWRDSRTELEMILEELKSLEEELKKFPPDMDKIIEREEKLIQALDEDIRRRETELNRLEGSLEELLSGDLYGEKAKLSEKIRTLENLYRAKLNRSIGVYILHGLSEIVKDRMFNTLITPISIMVREFISRVTGREREVELSKGLQVSSISEGGEFHEIDEYSTGTVEQLSLLVRIALGLKLADLEKQLIVLDDVLAYTDSERRKKIFQILEEASEKLQVIILTAHPERYSQLNYQKTFDIPALLEASSSSLA